MATHNFQIFDESMTDTMTDVDYQSDSQRTNGVIPGVADPLLHNKLYRQCSVMAYAIAQTIVARGYNADDSDPVALVNAIQRTFAFSVNGNVPNAAGAITAVRPIDAWPVGCLFITFNNTNPATLLGGGTWVQIKGKYIIAADTGYTVDGVTTYGAMTKSVPLVSHSHSFNTGSSGAHTHSSSNVSVSTTGNHSHNPGSLNLVGTFRGGKDGISGVFSKTSDYSRGMDDTYNGSNIRFEASGHWSGSVAANGSHSHTVSISSSGSHSHSGTTGTTGTSASFDVRPLSLAVYMWRRTA